MKENKLNLNVWSSTVVRRFYTFLSGGIRFGPGLVLRYKELNQMLQFTEYSGSDGRELDRSNFSKTFRIEKLQLKFVIRALCLDQVARRLIFLKQKFKKRKWFSESSCDKNKACERTDEAAEPRKTPMIIQRAWWIVEQLVRNAKLVGMAGVNLRKF